MTKRNGRSDYQCSGCKATIGYVRRSGLFLRTLTPLPTLKTKYLTGGALEVTCSCGRVTKIQWLGEVVRS